MLRNVKMVVIATVALCAVPAIGAVPTIADNDHNYTNFRSDALIVLFNPADYDVSNMTEEERAAFRDQRDQRKQSSKELSSSSLYGSARMINY